MGKAFVKAGPNRPEFDIGIADTAKVSDLTSGRVVLAGTSGELEDSGNLTFSSGVLTTTELDVTGGIVITGGSTLSHVNASGVGTITQLVSTTATVGAALYTCWHLLQRLRHNPVHTG